MSHLEKLEHIYSLNLIFVQRFCLFFAQQKEDLSDMWSNSIVFWQKSSIYIDSKLHKICEHISSKSKALWPWWVSMSVCLWGRGTIANGNHCRRISFIAVEAIKISLFLNDEGKKWRNINNFHTLFKLLEIVVERIDDSWQNLIEVTPTFTWDSFVSLYYSLSFFLRHQKWKFQII